MKFKARIDIVRQRGITNEEIMFKRIYYNVFGVFSRDNASHRIARDLKVCTEGSIC